jgi:hypothetical protein
LNYRAKNRLGSDCLKAKTALEGSTRETVHQVYEKGLNLLAWGKKREKETADSLKEAFLTTKDQQVLFSQHARSIDAEVLACLNWLKEFYAGKCLSLKIRPLRQVARSKESVYANLVPAYIPQMRTFPGCFRNYRYFEDRLGPKFLEKYKGIKSAFQRRNKSIQQSFDLIDGHSTLGEIYDTLEAELWSTNTPRSPYTYLTFEEIANYFQLLRDAQVIDFRKEP